MFLTQRIRDSPYSDHLNAGPLNNGFIGNATFVSGYPTWQKNSQDLFLNVFLMPDTFYSDQQFNGDLKCREVIKMIRLSGDLNHHSNNGHQCLLFE